MDNDDEMTVVYRVEPLNENEAAFLPQDLPEVVLDGSNMTTDTILAESRTRTLPNGGITSNYSESTYSPEVRNFYCDHQFILMMFEIIYQNQNSLQETESTDKFDDDRPYAQ